MNWHKIFSWVHFEHPHTGEKELSRPRVVIFMIGGFLIFLAIFLKNMVI